VFVTIGAKAEVLGDAEIKPANGVGKSHVVEGLNAITFAKADESGAGHRALVESEDKGAVVAGSVVSAGGVREMMIETQDAVPTEKLAKLMKGGICRCRLFGTGRQKFGDGDGREAGRLDLKVLEDAGEGKAGNVARLLKTGNFFFFQRGKDGALVQKSDGRIAAKF